MPYTRVKDIDMYFEESGSGTPLIFLHGALGAADAKSGWGGMVDLFALKWRTLNLEYRGHGRTNNPQSKLTYEMIADDVSTFIEGLNGGPVHIVGASDGAISAMHIAMTRPQLLKTIVCLGANFYNDSKVIEANRYFDLERIAQEGDDEEFARRHDRNKTPGYWRELVRQIAENLAVNPNYSAKDLSKILTPTLLIAGENDPYANPQQMLEMREAIPNSEMLIVNNASHFVNSTHPQIVGPIILDFLIRKGGDTDAEKEEGLLYVEKTPA
jgi:pimeloyl-ACP methyl ester carboxylesterase